MGDGKYVFVGYCAANNLSEVTREQARKLTHLNIAFGIVEDGAITVERIKDQLGYYVKKIQGYNPALNILLSTGGGALSQRPCHGEATRTPEGIERIVSSTMDAVRAYNMDGVDCDWEFPGWSGNRDERFQHTALMKAYRAALDAYAAGRGRPCFLTIAAGCSDTYIDNVELNELAVYLDFINLMCYDFRWEGTLTGHQCNTFAPLDDAGGSSAENGLNNYIAKGYPRDKLVLGAAFYSHRYDGVQGGGNGYGQPYTGRYTYGPTYTDISLKYEKSAYFAKYWDDAAKEPWLFDGDSFITYDDPMAMRFKCEYVKAMGLRGVMYWEHGGDRTHALFNAIYDHLML